MMRIELLVFVAEILLNLTDILANLIDIYQTVWPYVPIPW
jgi:hypothetical protein